MAKLGEQRYRQVESSMGARGKELGLDLYVAAPTAYLVASLSPTVLTNRPSSPFRLSSKWNGRVRQSISAHRLLTYAYKKDPKLQLVVLDKIFEEAFLNEKDVGDHEILAAIAEEAGVMTKEEVCHRGFILIDG